MLTCEQSPIVKNYDLSSIRFLGCGAAPVSPELTEQLLKTMPDPNALIGQAYGVYPVKDISLPGQHADLRAS